MARSLSPTTVSKSAPCGFYGESIASQLVHNQIFINRLARIIEKSLVSLANPNIFMPTGSEIVIDAYTRKIGSVIRR